METISNLIRYLVILIFISALLEMILPRGVFRSYLRMLIGILLIFTLLTPLQKIMRIAPYWEIPSSVENQDNENAGELEAILGLGEELYREKMRSALEDYQNQIFDLLEIELAREFDQKLLRLQVETEDDPDNREFGMLKSIYVATRAQEPVSGLEKESSDPAQEIRVSVKVDSPGLGGSAGEEETEDREEGPGPVGDLTPGVSGRDKAVEIAEYLATYFRLSSGDVEVEILP
ncbi:MAG: stage III sporulation protein AF [Firmicutes bacterium]|nr:stage III sporulation protein AF [Bacillota bacterium]